MTLFKRSSALTTVAYSLLLLLATVPALNRGFPPKEQPFFVVAADSGLDKAKPAMVVNYACENCQVPAVHGSNIIETLDGGMLATWFGGSREGGKDVALWGANYSPGKSGWSEPRRIIGPAETKLALGRYIKTVGNSVLVRGENNKLWLFYVTVSVGGWAGSSLNAILSTDDGKTWDSPRRLISSPFFNISTLAKCAAVMYSNGTIGLPVYHEFLGKFSELLLLDKNAQVRDKIRITHGRHSIQPQIIPLDNLRAITLMRNTGVQPGHLLYSESDAAGGDWSLDEELAPYNSDSAVAGLRRPDGSLLLVFNDRKAGRTSLALAVSRDQGRSWNTVKHFEQSDEVKNEYSYPYLIRSSSGTMHLVYTWNRKRIRHVSFNDSWVDEVKQ